MPDDDDCSEIIVDDEQSNHHDSVGNTSTNHVDHVKYDVENTSTNHVDHVGDNIFIQVTSNFSMRDASVLEDTNKLLSPRDVIKCRSRSISEKTKSLTIVKLFNPSTPDKMSTTLANGDILHPFVHDVKREQIYAGGSGGLLFDPVSTWVKFEECTLNLGSATLVEDNNTVFTTSINTDEEYSMDECQDSVQGGN